jgi:hypothetical protein
MSPRSLPPPQAEEGWSGGEAARRQNLPLPESHRLPSGLDQVEPALDQADIAGDTVDAGEEGGILAL